MHLPTLHLHRPRLPLFLIFYSTTFTLLLLLLSALLLITPGEQIYQSFRTHQIYHIFIIGGLYILTFLTALFIYGARLYAARAALAGIPREDFRNGMGRGVRRVVEEGAEKSAWVAWEGRPRDVSGEEGGKRRAWGTISHPGWSAPESTDLPNLHFEAVILELPLLLEAKAVSLAPTLHSSLSHSPDDAPFPDPLALSLLQRPSSMDLRTYITHLTSLSMLPSPTLTTDFLSIYETARFSGCELNEIEFRGLMSVFAEMLRGMRPLGTETMEEMLRAQLLEEGRDMDTDMGEEEGEGDSAEAQSFITNDTVEHTPLPEEWISARPEAWTSSSSSSSSTSEHNTPTGPPRLSARSDDSPTSKSIRRGLRTPSIPSLKRMRSGTTSSGYSSRSFAGSVIRLKEARGKLDLPFEYIGVEGDG